MLLCCFINRRNLKIASRTLSDVINRERLCGTIAFYFGGFHKVSGCSSEAPCQSLFVCLFVCLFVRLFAGISSHSEDHHAHFTRSGKQSEIARSSHPEGVHTVKCRVVWW